MSHVDVIVPCYNYGRFLSECVHSISAQQGVELRILILDDASTDDTPEVSARLAREDPRVRVRRHDRNRGNVATFNEGLGWATADYLALISADDLLLPGALRRATELLDACPRAGLAYGRVVMHRAGDPPSESREVAATSGWSVCRGLEWLRGVCETRGNAIISPEVVVRTSVQRKLGGYRAELPYSGDIEMWNRFALCSDIGILDADQALYRVHAANMHTERDSIRVLHLRDRFHAFEYAFRDFGDGSKEQRDLDRLARRIFAREALWAVDQSQLDAEVSRDLITFALEICSPARFSREYLGICGRRLLGSRAFDLLRYLGKGRRDHHVGRLPVH
jgi:glycosyltransferase involved in cell wall biosynthesis